MYKQFSKKGKRKFFTIKNRLSPQGKLLLIAAGMAFCIGSLLGFISLQMTKQEETSVNLEAVSNQTVSSKSETEKKHFDSIQFFVIQGGLFSSEENANKQAEQFLEQNYHTYNWVSNDGVYVIAGLANNEGKAKAIANKMDKQKLDVYVKKWEIEKAERILTEAEYTWIKEFISLWQQTVEVLEEDKAPPQEKWKELMNKKIAITSDAAVITKIKEIWNERDNVNNTVLLQMIFIYNQEIRMK